MTVVAFALGLFTTAFLIHLVWWRLARPRRALLGLLLIFHAVLVLGLLVATNVPGLDRYAPSGFWQIAHVCLFHVAFALGYTVTYTALEMDSPTLTIIAYVAAAGTSGRSLDDLLHLVRDEQIVGTRFEALTAAGIITPGSEARYVLTPKGRHVALVFHGFRRLYRLDKGG